MKILITSGGMREPIDDVRIITNISTGKLGMEIAQKLLCGNTITFVYTKGSCLPSSFFSERMQLIETSSFKEVENVLKQEVPKHDVIIHVMAVSDFSFKSNKKIKIHSKEDLIEHMKNTIIDNPKLLSKFRDWNKDAFIVGFKFEVGKTKDELVAIARRQNLRNNINLTIANDKIEMNKAKSHIAYIVDSFRTNVKCESKKDIAEKLSKLVEHHYEN